MALDKEERKRLRGKDRRPEKNTESWKAEKRVSRSFLPGGKTGVKREGYHRGRTKYAAPIPRRKTGVGIPVPVQPESWPQKV